MITYSPTYISITPFKDTYSIAATSDHNQALLLTWVTIDQSTPQLTIAQCHTSVIPSLTKQLSPSDVAQLLQCITTDKQLVALELSQATLGTSERLGAEERVIIPFLFESKNSLFAKKTDEAVLGEFQKELVVDNLHCEPSILWTRDTVTCSAFLKNQSEGPVLVETIITVEQQQLAVTKSYEKTFPQAQLILPQQQYHLVFILPRNGYSIAKNMVTVQASFRSPGIVAPSFVAQRTTSLYYIPLLFIIFGILTLVTLSVILAKRILPKLLHQKHGATKKTNHL